MTASGPQWSVHSYAMDESTADGLADAFAAIDFHDFMMSSRCDGLVDLACYGRNGILPVAVLGLLNDYEAQSVSLVDEQSLIAEADGDQPTALCPGVRIVPEASRHLYQQEPGTSDLILGQGPAFGDGRHPTTRAAARLIQRHEWAGLTVHDVGAGSGILGLLALRLGAMEITFSDIDDDALRTCRRSCELNGYAKATVQRSDLLRDLPEQPVNAIIANIYAELLLELLADSKLGTILPRGDLLLSGISFQKVDGVRSSLSDHGFTIRAEEQDQWWFALHAQR